MKKPGILSNPGFSEVYVTKSSYNKYHLCELSSETVNFFLPLALRAEIIDLPLAVDILFLKPCLFVRLRLDGW